ncbi:DNA polymerase III subunit delta [compost metagenome]
MQLKIHDYLKDNLSTINQTVVLIIIEDDLGKNKLVDLFDKHGVLCKFEFQTAQALQVRLKKICNAYKVNIDTSTMQYFIESCGTNMQEVINEIRKLIEFVGNNGTIDKTIIDKLCIKKIESIIFDLTDNLGKKNIKEALDVLNNMIYNKEPVQVIFITLYRHFKKLYMIKLAVNENRDIAETLSLKANQMFLVNKYKIQAGSFDKKELEKILMEMQNLDFKSKIGLMDLEIGLDSILCTYCSK